MEIFYLLGAGVQVSMIHAYLIWVHRNDRKATLSEHVAIDQRSRTIYIASHIICDLLFFLFSYQFFIVNHNLPLLHYLNIVFIILDFLQATLPARGGTRFAHTIAAYISWCCYLLSGTLALFLLNVAQPFKTIALVILIPTIAMFLYIHVRRKKIWFYQLIIVPMFVLYLAMVVLGVK